MRKCAVFCSQGIGDGLLFCLLSHNLQQIGFQVDTYHNLLPELQEFLPGFSLKKNVSDEEFYSLCSSYEKVFINLDSQNDKRARWAKEKFPHSVYLLKPTTCKGKNIYREGFLDPKKTVAENLFSFCRDILFLPKVEKNCGMVAPSSLSYRKYKKRIAIHPTSRDLSRNWPVQKFYQLKIALETKGYEVVFIVSPKEAQVWKAPYFASLHETASFLYESGYFIGNDSGIGHLASSLQIPTLTIFSSRRKEPFWRPDWTIGKTIKPSFWIPNIKGFRLQEKLGSSCISVKEVCRGFSQLQALTQEGFLL
ncbi:MAG: glycosyltransferase family 9 protein [Chlamydiota bacterium]